MFAQVTDKNVGGVFYETQCTLTAKDLKVSQLLMQVTNLLLFFIHAAHLMSQLID